MSTVDRILSDISGHISPPTQRVPAVVRPVVRYDQRQVAGEYFRMMPRHQNNVLSIVFDDEVEVMFRCLDQVGACTSRSAKTPDTAHPGAKEITSGYRDMISFRNDMDPRKGSSTELCNSDRLSSIMSTARSVSAQVELCCEPTGSRGQGVILQVDLLGSAMTALQAKVASAG
jgi:hypothetical protein